jgi:hypothetical protein
MNYTVWAYLIYLPLTIGLTLYVGHTLFKNGAVFLLDIFAKNERLANSVNKLLLTGFYLINLGYLLYMLTTKEQIPDLVTLIEVLSVKVGFIVVVLGLMHFFNIYLFYRIRKKSLQEQRMQQMYS